MQVGQRLVPQDALCSCGNRQQCMEQVWWEGTKQQLCTHHICGHAAMLPTKHAGATSSRTCSRAPVQPNSQLTNQLPQQWCCAGYAILPHCCQPAQLLPLLLPKQ